MLSKLRAVIQMVADLLGGGVPVLLPAGLLYYLAQDTVPGLFQVGAANVVSGVVLGERRKAA